MAHPNRTLAEAKQDDMYEKMHRLKRLVGLVPNGYCHQAIELVGTCRQISIRIQDESLLHLEGEFHNVVRLVSQTLQSKKSRESSFVEATKSLVAFCHKNGELVDDPERPEGIVVRMKNAKDRDESAFNWLENNRKKSPHSLQTIHVELYSVQPGRQKPHVYLNTRLPCKAPLCLLLSIVVDKKSAVTLDQDPTFYYWDREREANNTDLGAFHSRSLDDVVLEPDGQVRAVQINILILINICYLSHRDHGNYGVTFDPTGKNDVVLKDVYGSLHKVENKLDPTTPFRFKDILVGTTSNWENKNLEDLFQTLKKRGGHFLIRDGVETPPGIPAESDAQLPNEGWIPRLVKAGKKALGWG